MQLSIYLYTHAVAYTQGEVSSSIVTLLVWGQTYIFLNFQLLTFFGLRGLFFFNCSKRKSF